MSGMWITCALCGEQHACTGTLTLLPTDSDTRDYVVSELEPIFVATRPCLRGALARAMRTSAGGGAHGGEWSLCS
jgi:hypothetical protein